MTLKEKEQKKDEVILLLSKYLQLNSLDGVSARRPLRKEMKKLLAEIQKNS